MILPCVIRDSKGLCMFNWRSWHDHYSHTNWLFQLRPLLCQDPFENLTLRQLSQPCFHTTSCHSVPLDLLKMPQRLQAGFTTATIPVACCFVVTCSPYFHGLLPFTRMLHDYQLETSKFMCTVKSLTDSEMKSFTVSSLLKQ